MPACHQARYGLITNSCVLPLHPNAELKETDMRLMWKLHPWKQVHEWINYLGKCACGSFSCSKGRAA